MKATITTKGQITIPIGIRRNLKLKAGDVLEFDETAPYLKATRAIAPKAWVLFEEAWQDPWPNHPTEDVLDEIRGPVELPPGGTGE
jgi:AbrB family looped-hinge helix DNA binding protein